ncbi:hypothetical protein [Rhodococcus tukisamuensis]|uniref:Acetoin utilization deacetylase AcuC n=1 Tax=Rhodococcus tukisamuensis TaxID=168276 RepID=A0A1G6Z724_9NOCA|nr:hypothetical protein [Rhodococcus tukisamuensis]SDD98554.1 Acetoin utilization deacetylase AcuC [Rhodococcus tukisamuensis]
MKLYYSPDYVGSSYSFDTTRKSQWIADSLLRSPIAGVELTRPRVLSVDQFAQVHDPAYVDAVVTGEPRQLAEGQGFDWDAGLFPMVQASNGGAVEAAIAALREGVAGSLSSGLHHARYGSGSGFCTFNGLALASKAALAAGAGNVLIVDLDAHCGGGTASLIADEARIWQVDVSVSMFDMYAGTDRAKLAEVTDADRYLSEIGQALSRIERLGPRFDLVLYNAGMDPYEGCAVGGLDGITAEILAERERFVFEWCRTRGIAAAFVLAGGYIGERLDAETLVDLHRSTIAAAAESVARQSR